MIHRDIFDNFDENVTRLQRYAGWFFVLGCLGSVAVVGFIFSLVYTLVMWLTATPLVF